MTVQPATIKDRGKTCTCGHAIYVVRGQVKCFCSSPQVWKANVGYNVNPIALTASNSDR